MYVDSLPINARKSIYLLVKCIVHMGVNDLRDLWAHGLDMV